MMKSRLGLWLCLCSVFILTSCQDYNSNTFDSVKYSGGSTETDPNFEPAFDVITKNCINCHQGYHNTWASYTTNELWLAQGNLVIQGDQANSQLVRKIRNSFEVGANMPPSGPISEGEFVKIQTWITNIP